jgi:F-type H+-transporting ATPase subunit delta
MKLTKEARKLSKELFRASFTNGKLNEARVRTLANAVASRKPRHYIDVLKNYLRLVRLESEKHHAIIESATPLDPQTTGKVSVDLKLKYGWDLATDFKVNPGLLGGLRIKIGSDVWDGSVRNRLARLGEELAQA